MFGYGGKGTRHVRIAPVICRGFVKEIKEAERLRTGSKRVTDMGDSHSEFCPSKKHQDQDVKNWTPKARIRKSCLAFLFKIVLIKMFCILHHHNLITTS